MKNKYIKNTNEDIMKLIKQIKNKKLKFLEIKCNQIKISMDWLKLWLISHSLHKLRWIIYVNMKVRIIKLPEEKNRSIYIHVFGGGQRYFDELEKTLNQKEDKSN